MVEFKQCCRLVVYWSRFSIMPARISSIRSRLSFASERMYWSRGRKHFVGQTSFKIGHLLTMSRRRLRRASFAGKGGPIGWRARCLTMIKPCWSIYGSMRSTRSDCPNLILSSWVTRWEPLTRCVQTPSQYHWVEDKSRFLNWIIDWKSMCYLCIYKFVFVF
jgi:hypothetical protein